MSSRKRCFIKVQLECPYAVAIDFSSRISNGSFRRNPLLGSQLGNGKNVPRRGVPPPATRDHGTNPLRGRVAWGDVA
jgi:hypothetical protein